MNKFKEQGMKIVFMVAACVSILAVLLICLFLFASVFRQSERSGPWSSSSEPSGDRPMISTVFSP